LIQIERYIDQGWKTYLIGIELDWIEYELILEIMIIIMIKRKKGDEGSYKE
jgi:hypothetical protein